MYQFVPGWERFVVSGEVEVVKQFFRNSLNIWDGNVNFVSAIEWLAISVFLAIERFEGLKDSLSSFDSHTWPRHFGGVCIRLFRYVRGDNAVCPVEKGCYQCQFVFQMVVRVKGQILISVRRFPEYLAAVLLYDSLGIPRKGSMLSWLDLWTWCSYLPGWCGQKSHWLLSFQPAISVVYKSKQVEWGAWVSLQVPIAFFSNVSM